jgi:cytochrome c5
MAERVAAKGLEGVVQSAINGLNAMPPKGGNPSLSDEQIQAAVEFMLP